MNSGQQTPEEITQNNTTVPMDAGIQIDGVMAAQIALEWLVEEDLADGFDSAPCDWRLLKPERLVVRPANRAKYQPVQPDHSQTQAKAPQTSTSHPAPQALHLGPTSGQPPLVRASQAAASHPSDEAAIAAAKLIASQSESLSELNQAIAGFDGCPLKRLAKNTVFADGTPEADVMFIGEAPKADEDRVGRPLIGDSGQLLNAMLEHIGLRREENFYLTNYLFWRPPGDRTATATEISICDPFVRRHIALAKPKVLVFLGGMPTRALTGKSDSILRQRGHWTSYQDPLHSLEIPALPMLHPAYLLKHTKAKREAWTDCLRLKRAMLDMGLSS